MNFAITRKAWANVKFVGLRKNHVVDALVIDGKAVYIRRSNQ